MAKYSSILSLQIKKIHIAKSQLGLSDEQYRSTLSGFVNKFGQPALSCKDLSYAQAEVLINIFKKLGFKEKHSGQVKKYEDLSNRDSKFATPGQLRKIEGLWFSSPAVREKTETALNNFIAGIAHVTLITSVLKQDVKKIIKAIEAL